MTPRRLEVARIPVNFADVQEFEALPEDEYDAIIEKAEMRLPTEDGKFPYINLQFKITESGEYEGRVTFTILSFSPKALFRMKQAFENLGIIDPDDELDIDYDEETFAVTSPELVGVPCRLTLGTRTYEGNLQNEVKAITAIDGAKVGEKTTPARKPAAAKKPAARKPAEKKKTFR
jgi:hypothetical protein